jgi:hypothetical protein
LQDAAENVLTCAGMYTSSANSRARAAAHQILSSPIQNILREIIAVHKAIGEETVTSEMQVTMVSSGLPFVSQHMQQEDATSRGRVQQPNIVFCTVGLGLRLLHKKENGEYHEAVTLKTTVILNGDEE